MKILVAFYSRDGHTKKTAEALAQNLGADIEEIIDLQKRSGIWGWLGGGNRAFKSMMAASGLTPISVMELKAGDFDSPNYLQKITDFVSQIKM